MAGNTWELTTSMPSAGLGTAMIGGKIYAISGQDQPYSYLAKVESYNPVTNTWLVGCADIPTARQSFSVVAVNNKIYAIGGFDGGRLNTVEVYVPPE